MFFIAYAFKGQVHVFEGRVKIVSHSPCRTSAILKYFCPLRADIFQMANFHNQRAITTESIVQHFIQLLTIEALDMM